MQISLVTACLGQVRQVSQGHELPKEDAWLLWSLSRHSCRLALYEAELDLSTLLSNIFVTRPA